MGSVEGLLERTSAPLTGDAVETALLCLLLAFVLGQVIAWAYVSTHAGLSYSRAFTQSLVLLTMIVALVMLVIGNNIVTAFGLLGALAIIRFRNVLKDTRDTAFIFLALVVGMAIGAQKFLTAIVGTAAILLAAVYLYYTGFGTQGRYDGHLSFTVAAGRDGDDDPGGLVARFCSSVRRISVRRVGDEEASEYVFQVRLRDRGRYHEFVDALSTAAGVSDVALVMRDELAEV